ncbi:hypothetical protein [Parafrankia sp. EUN1f]|uniref:hypothetical protein n=1 Tax=Parafrankia sp. EUN1f TaxID=102897 RepID=UPI0001C45F88|nr:hypothetical protein [Parafrankia sp. EUN1f]EFC81509.1 hypothetical protein FrEUN1fDRAFT_5396 [Parafrankia sp. EUN1f]
MAVLAGQDRAAGRAADRGRAQLSVKVSPESRIRAAVCGIASQYGDVVWSRSSARMRTKFGRSVELAALTAESVPPAVAAPVPGATSAHERPVRWLL